MHNYLMEAWIYPRVSRDEQGEDYSLERQLTQGRAFIERMGWSHSPEREINGEGRSAFRARDRAEGAGEAVLSNTLEPA